MLSLTHFDEQVGASCTNVGGEHVLGGTYIDVVGPQNIHEVVTVVVKVFPDHLGTKFVIGSGLLFKPDYWMDLHFDIKDHEVRASITVRIVWLRTNVTCMS
jgi:hypothetical protein